MYKFMAMTILAGIVSYANAERPPQAKDKANLAITGTVKKITTKESEFNKTGIRTDYTAEIVIDSIEHGDGAKVGDTITVTWFKVTKLPADQLIDGAFGHAHDIKVKDKAKFWLMSKGLNVPAGTWVIIYNKDGVEKITNK